MKYILTLTLAAGALLLTSCEKKTIVRTYTCQCLNANGDPILDIPLKTSSQGHAISSCSGYNSTTAGRYKCTIID